MTVSLSESFDVVGEGFNETCFVMLSIQAECERLLTRFDDVVRSQDDDSGDELDWDTFFEEIYDQNTGGDELDAALVVHALAGNKIDSIFKRP